MRTKLMAVIALLVTTGLLAGCIVEPGGYGYGHRHYYHDRY